MPGHLDNRLQIIDAGEMTKWLDTNYHYIVPEFAADTTFKLDSSRLLRQLEQARHLKVNAKPVLIGHVTYLWLGKAKDDSDKLALLNSFFPLYAQLLQKLAAQGMEWVQIDEPILVTELDSSWQQALATAYNALSQAANVKILLVTYSKKPRCTNACHCANRNGPTTSAGQPISPAWTPT